MSETDQDALRRLVSDGRLRAVELALPGSAGAPFPGLAELRRRYAGGGDAPAVLLLGDSVSVRVAHGDSDPRPLHRMVADMLPVSSAAIVSSAFQGEIFRDLMCALAVLPRRPTLVVMPINLRAFSPQWHSNPLWEMRQEREIIRRFVDDPAIAIDPVETVVAGPGFFDRYDATPARSVLSDLQSNGEFRALSLAQPSDERDAALRYRELFAWHYGFRLVREHPKLRALAEAVATAADLCGRVMTYITPINMEMGAHLLGNRFRGQMAETVDTARAGLASAGPGGTLDFCSYLGKQYFFHTNLATEHLRDTGRSKLARAIVAGIERQLEKP